MKVEQGFRQALGIPLSWGVEFHGPVHRPTLTILFRFWLLDSEQPHMTGGLRTTRKECEGFHRLSSSQVQCTEECFNALPPHE